MAPPPRVRELGELAKLSASDFEQAVGPFVLVQRPPDPVLQRMALNVAGARTVGMAHRSRLAEQVMSMGKSFDRLQVITPKPTQPRQDFVVGRLPESDLPVLEPSVSSRHALLRWNAEEGTCTVRDLGSTNGTFLNASEIGQRELRLQDGDSICFGDAQFIYLAAGTLQSHLISALQREQGGGAGA
jgi:hypothetical protein